MRLDRGLLVDGEDARMRRRREAEADHVGRLGLEGRIVARDVALEPERFEPGTLPHRAGQASGNFRARGDCVIIGLAIRLHHFIYVWIHVWIAPA